MSYRNVSCFLELYGDKPIRRVRNYLNDFKEWQATTGQSLSENELHFMWSNIYECRINYSPVFFRSLVQTYLEAVQRANRSDILASLENKIRIIRYMAQLVVPGAYLDDIIPLKDKLDFLEQFSTDALAVIEDDTHKCTDAVLHTMSPVQEQDRRFVGAFIATLGEACDQIYLGEQPIGFPAFWLASFPERWALYQEFDLNLGSRHVSNLGRVTTLTSYPRQIYEIREELDDVHVFQHRPVGEDQWRSERPQSSDIKEASILINGSALTCHEIRLEIKKLVPVISEVSRLRDSLSRSDLNADYCSMQSQSVRNLKRLIGEEWAFPEEAHAALQENSTAEKLKRAWRRTYYIEVMDELNNRAFRWLKDVAR